jgi:FixJ family two-component response regulator
MEAEDAGPALKRLEGIGSIDLSSTDVSLPNGMNGYQLPDALTERLPCLNVLFITGFFNIAAVREEMLPS